MKKILIVDDESDIREIYKDLITHEYEEVEITFAEDGLDAFVKCSEKKFDLLTLDHMMPNMTGGNFLVALRNKPGLNQSTPVIMISAFLPKLSETTKAVENTFFVEKPIVLNRLIRYLNITLKLESKTKLQAISLEEVDN